jgi:hypothetical protein
LRSSTLFFDRGTQTHVTDTQHFIRLLIQKDQFVEAEYFFFDRGTQTHVTDTQHFIRLLIQKPQNIYYILPLWSTFVSIETSCLVA